MALVMVLLLGTLLAAIGLSVALVADVDTMIAGNHRHGLAARYTSEGVADAMVDELASMADWTPVLAGTTSSSFAGPLVLPASLGAEPVDAAGLTAAVQQEAYGGSLWGIDTPRWRLFGHGVPGQDLPFSGLSERSYALVWVSDDVAESDGQPFADTNDTIVVRVRAMGAGRTRADVQIVITRVAPGIVRR